MYKIILMLICVLFSVFPVQAGYFVMSGEYYRYFEDDGTVVRDKFVEKDRNKYYINPDGYVAFNSWVTKDDNYYYAGNEGILCKDGVYDIEKNSYYFNENCEMQKGWCKDYTYYADETDGFLLTGFHELEVPRGFITEDTVRVGSAWFYFDSITHKRYVAEYDAYVSKMIGTSRYCFDQNGIMRTGWRRIKDTEPAMKGYMFFAEESTKDFKYGEALTNTWYSIDPPDDVVPSGEVRFFYFNGQGQPRCAPVGKFQKVRLNEKTYLFNEYGYATYGVRQIGDDIYYFGPSIDNCSMKTGTISGDIDGSGEENSYYFTEDGVGYTGVYKNKLYYKGKLQKASREQKYAGIRIGNTLRLVSTGGVVQKNKRNVRDGDDCRWSTGESGIVTSYDEDAYITPAEAPRITDAD